MYLVHALLYCSLIVCALKNLHNISSACNVKFSKRKIFMRSFIALGQELNFAQTQQAYQHINESLYE